MGVPMTMNTHRILAGAATLALALTPAAIAKKPDDPGSKGKGKAHEALVIRLRD